MKKYLNKILFTIGLLAVLSGTANAAYIDDYVSSLDPMGKLNYEYLDTFNGGAFDSSTNALNTVTYEHHEIHSGSHYNYCDYILNQALGYTEEFIITTPDTDKHIHLALEASASDGATIELYEGASGITGGTIITPRNNNRNSVNTSDIVTFLRNPSAITSDGVRAAGLLAGGTRSSGGFDRENEFVLKRNETYLLRITSLANSNDLAWCAEWYEHTDNN